MGIILSCLGPELYWIIFTIYFSVLKVNQELSPLEKWVPYIVAVLSCLFFVLNTKSPVLFGRVLAANSALAFLSISYLLFRNIDFGFWVYSPIYIPFLTILLSLIILRIEVSSFKTFFTGLGIGICLGLIYVLIAWGSISYFADRKQSEINYLPPDAVIDYATAYRYATAWAYRDDDDVKRLFRNDEGFYGTLGSLEFQFSNSDKILHVWAFVMPGAGHLPPDERSKFIDSQLDQIAKENPEETAGAVFDTKTLIWNKQPGEDLEPCLWLRMDFSGKAMPTKDFIQKLDMLSRTAYIWNRQKIQQVISESWKAYPRKASDKKSSTPTAVTKPAIDNRSLDDLYSELTDYYYNRVVPKDQAIKAAAQTRESFKTFSEDLQKNQLKEILSGKYQ